MRISDWSSDVCSSDLVQQHLDEHQQAEVEPLRVEPHPESEDVAVLLQSLQPLAGGRRGQPDLVGEVNRSDPPVFLENLQHPPVRLVDRQDFLRKIMQSARIIRSTFRNHKSEEHTSELQ